MKFSEKVHLVRTKLGYSQERLAQVFCILNMKNNGQVINVLNVVDVQRYDKEVRKFNEAVRKITEAVILPEKNESWQ